MPDWTAITGIVVAGVVGPAVGALWERSRQGRQFHHEVTMRDVAELRSLLDDAAQSLERVDHARGAAYGRILQEGRYPTEAGGEATNRFRTKVAALSVLKARLSIRLGETDSLHQLFSDALTALVQVLDAIDMAAFMREQADMVELNERMEAGEADFKKARAEGNRPADAAAFLRRLVVGGLTSGRAASQGRVLRVLTVIRGSCARHRGASF
jgi:hypothetical protein